MTPVVPLSPEIGDLPCSVPDLDQALPHAWVQDTSPVINSADSAGFQPRANGHGVVGGGTGRTLPPVKHRRIEGGESPPAATKQPLPQLPPELRVLMQMQHQELMRRLDSWITERDDKMERCLKVFTKMAQLSPATTGLEEAANSITPTLALPADPDKAIVSRSSKTPEGWDAKPSIAKSDERVHTFGEPDNLVLTINDKPEVVAVPQIPQGMDEDAEDQDQDHQIHKVGKDAPEAGWRQKLQVFLGGNAFEAICGITIMTNALFIGVEIDYTAAHLDQTPPVTFLIIGYIYTILFAIELVLKIVADRMFFFWPEQTKQFIWNYLDLIIVMSSLAEVALDVVSLSAAGDEGGGTNNVSMDNLRIIRIVRLSRLMRLFRIGRIVRFVRSLRTLVISILSTLKSVFWSMLLLVIIMYVFAILFTQAASDYQVSIDIGGEDPGLDPPDAELLEYHWGSLGDAILTLYMSISGGVSWFEVMRPLREVSSVWMFVFLAYISFTYFAVLNVVTGVFCQSAIESTQYDQDAMIQAFLMNKQVYTNRFEALFKSLDTDNSGIITKDEFLDHIHDAKVQAFFASLELEASDAIQLFRMIDADEGVADTGIDIEDFVVGCLRLKGNARSCDMARLMFENKALARDISELSEYLEAQFKVLCGQRALSSQKFLHTTARHSVVGLPGQATKKERLTKPKKKGGDIAQKVPIAENIPEEATSDVPAADLPHLQRGFL